MEASSRLAVRQAFEAVDAIDSIRIEDKGFSVLADPPSACLDVIFVHGLTGHARRTWTFTGPKTPSDARKTLQTDDSSERPSKIQRLFRPSSSDSTTTSDDVFWPLDLLAQTLPNARLLAYGYDSNIRHRLQVPVNQSTILDLGQDLLTDLEALRRSQPTRPLIFVAHSLGGIIAKETLRRSEGHRVYQKEFYSIYDATVALMFFGTPHRGADPQSLLRSISETVIRLAGYTINNRLVDGLLPSSERLKELREEFSKMSRTKDWRIYSFQEQYGMQTLNGKKVVEDESSNLDDPTIEITQRIGGDHVQMCRFKGFDDVEYRKVAAAFDRLARFGVKDTNKLEILFTEEQANACLESLAFKQIDDRFMNIRRALHATCTWLFGQVEYRNWLDIDKIHDHHGFLWIKGKPGAGKSTIMKHVFLRCKKNLGTAKIISYFFNARGDIMEKSTLGMYRSLVYQLLKAIPRLQVDLIPRFLEKKRYSEVIEWSIGELQDFLSGAFKRIRERQFIFIDALDECEENEVRDMIEFLEQLGNDALSCGMYLNICLSSRHYPHIRIKKGIQLVVEGQRGHDGDIAKYVDSKLEAEGQDSDIDDIKAEILRKASGVFLWVVLVVQMLNKAFDHGQVHAVQEQLLEIPDKLDGLFTDILTRDAENKNDSTLLLQWLVFARRSLKPKELYIAVRSGNDPTALQAWDHIQASDQNVEKFILSCSKGLAEISRSKDHTVQFIHESVRDYFLRKNGLARLQAELSSPTLGSSQDRLTQCCYQYIMIDTSQHLPLHIELPKANSKEAKDLKDLASAKFPFLSYAVQNIFGHADAAEGYGISQIAFLKEFCPPNGSKLKKWITYNNIFQRYEIRRYSHGATLLYILSEQDHSNIVKVLLDDVVDIDAAGERYGSALQAASVNGHERIVQLLVDAGANTNLESREYGSSLFAAIGKGHNDIITLLVKGGANIDVRNRSGATMLYRASSNGQQELVQQLLEIGADVNADGGLYRRALLAALQNRHEVVARLLLEKGADANGEAGLWINPLLLASNSGHEAVVRLLLEKGADVNAQGGSDGNALQAASLKGHEAVVRLLLEKGADVNAQGGFYGNALQAASKSGNEVIVRLLLEKGADVNAQGGFYGNALQAASKSGNEVIVRLLLEKGADVNAQGGYYGNALLAALENGHEATVRLLLDKGADANARGGSYGNALLLASKSGHEAVVRLLLEKGADVNAQEGLHGTALLAASENGHEAIVQLLLEKGADMNAEGGLSGNALLVALEKGHEGIVRLLLEKGADANAQGGQYGNALLVALEKGHEGIVRLLLEKGANANAQEGQYGNALQAASREGYEAVVWLLLEKGADVNAQGGYYGNALQAALEKGHEGIVRLLLEKGADANAQGGPYGNALQVASGKGNEGLVRLLLDKGADANAQGGKYGNALQAASQNGREAAIRLLLEKGADANAQGGKYGNALQAASQNGREAVVRLLLEKGADVNAQGGEYGNALQAALHNGYVVIVRLLLEKGADVNAQGGKYSNAMLAALQYGNGAVIRLLVEKGADVNVQGGPYGNALQVASGKGNEGLVRLLLDKGANVNAQGGYYGNALQAASNYVDQAVVRLLLEKGADVNAQGGEYGNALQAALHDGYLVIVRLLLEKGAKFL